MLPAPTTNQKPNFKGTLNLMSPNEFNATQFPTNPTGLKGLIISKHPNGIASDGRRYADIPALELANKITTKFPNGVTNDGRKYSDFLGTPAAQPKTQNALGATFPSTGTESKLGGALKTIGNIPSSAYQFAKNTLMFPVNSLQNISQIPEEFHSLIEESGGVKKAGEEFAKEFNKQLLPSIYGALVPQATQQIIAGDFQGARATIQNDPVGQILPYILTGKAAAEKAGVGAQFDSAISKIASPITKPASAIGRGTANIAGGAGRFVAGQITGISPETIQRIITEPQKFTEEARSNITRQNLASEIGKALDTRRMALEDTGASYAGIRSMTEPVTVAPNYLGKLIEKTTGLKVAEGKLTPTGASTVRLPADVNALQSKLFDLWEPEFAKGYLTAEEFLNFRADLARMAYNDSGIKSGALANLAEIMRGRANSEIRPNIAGLEALDKEYAPQIAEIKALGKGLVDKEGNLTDTSINKIASATGRGKDNQLARLEELSPGITERIKMLKAVEDLTFSSRETKVGTYARAGALVAGAVTFNPYLIVAALASIPEIAVPLLRGLGYSNATIANLMQTLGISGALKTVNNLPDNATPLMTKDINAIMRENDVQAGLSTKVDTSVGVSPVSVAKKIGGGDIKLVQNYVNDPSLDNLIKLQPILEPMGIGKLDPAMVKRFFEEVINERNSPDFKPAPISQTTPIRNADNTRLAGSKSALPKSTR